MITMVLPRPLKLGENYAGTWKLYDLIDVLNDAGHLCQGWEHWHQPHPPPDTDLLLMPEIYGEGVRTLAPGVPRIVLNQNVHYSWLGVDDPTRHPYVDNPDLVRVCAVSAHTQQTLRDVFPGLDVRRWWTSIGRPEDFYCGPFPRPKRLCYFARKMPEESTLLLGMLTSAGALDGWEVMQLDGLSSTLIGEIMRTSRLHLAFQRLEGIGTPALEAIACGCAVIGFSGTGGNEYFPPTYSWPVHSVTEMFLAVRRRLKDPPDAAVRQSRSRYVLEQYSREQEIESFVAAVTGD